MGAGGQDNPMESVGSPRELGLPFEDWRPRQDEMALTFPPSVLQYPRLQSTGVTGQNAPTETPFIGCSLWSGQPAHPGGYRDHSIRGVFVMKTKKCSQCGEVKPITEFCKAKNQHDGLQGWCKKCINEYKRVWREQRRSDERKYALNHIRGNQSLVKRGLKKCRHCGIVKILNEFHAGEGTGGVQSKCSECYRELYHSNGYQPPSPERRAQKAVYDAIQRGDITRPTTCSICGVTPIVRSYTRIQFHHTDGYEGKNRFVGVFACAKCHAAIHLGKITVEGKKWL